MYAYEASYMYGIGSWGVSYEVHGESWKVVLPLRDRVIFSYGVLGSKKLCMWCAKCSEGIKSEHVHVFESLANVHTDVTASYFVEQLRDNLADFYEASYRISTRN